jgi:hypothetical protein
MHARGPANVSRHMKPSKDPLAELLDELSLHGALPPWWQARSAPDDDFREAFAASEHGYFAMLAAAATTPLRDAVRAAEACALLALPLAGARRPVAEAALSVAAAWSRAEASLDAVGRAHAAVRAAIGPDDDPERAAHSATIAATHVLDLIVDPPTSPRDLGVGAAAAAHSVAMSLGFAGCAGPSDPAWGRWVESAYRVMAPIVRAHLPCPTFEQVCEAYRAR